MIRDEADLGAAIASAKVPLRIKGGGTRDLRRDGAILDLSGLSGITLYEPGALTMVAKAGTPVAEIEATLAAEGQQLAFEPYFLTEGPSTIGGVMATNASGPRRIQAGAARDFLLGVRLVDGSGTVVKNGGRVMKNVTGYDLVKLMAGARGRLGALSEVSFKVLPKPETEGTLVLHKHEGTPVAMMAKALGAPFDVSGAAHSPSSGAIYLRVEGTEASVAYRLGQLQTLYGKSVESELVSGAASASLWSDIRDVRALGDHPLLTRMSIKPSDFDAFAAAAADTFSRDGVPDFDMMLDWGGGAVWLAATDAQLARISTADPQPGLDAVANGARILHGYAQSYCASQGGHATLMRAPDKTLPHVSIQQPQTPAVAALSAGLCAKFDPRGLFDHGKAA